MTSPRSAVFGFIMLWAWLLPSWTLAEDAPASIAVIAHVNFEHASLTPAELAAIFRRTEIIDGRGQSLVPVNLPGHHGLRVAFSRALFKLEPAEMEDYWNQRYFHGVAPPHVVASVEAMLRFVAVTDGAIGYVPACAVDARVKVVAYLDAPHTERSLLSCQGEAIPKLQTGLAH